MTEAEVDALLERIEEWLDFNLRDQHWHDVQALVEELIEARMDVMRLRVKHDDAEGSA